MHRQDVKTVALAPAHDSAVAEPRNMTRNIMNEETYETTIEQSENKQLDLFRSPADVGDDH